MAEQAVEAEPIGALIPSGHCSFPVTADPQSSHERCARNGGGSRANPKKVFTPCPCSCHYGETYECGGCGRPIVECLAWPFDVDGDLHYTHVDARGWATGEECGTVRPTVSRNPERSEVEDEESYECEWAGGCDLTASKPKVNGLILCVPHAEQTMRTKDCIRCGDPFTGNRDNPVCPKCTAEDEPEDDFSDLGDDEEVDEFAAMLAEFDMDEEE